MRNMPLRTGSLKPRRRVRISVPASTSALTFFPLSANGAPQSQDQLLDKNCDKPHQADHFDVCNQQKILEIWGHDEYSYYGSVLFRVGTIRSAVCFEAESLSRPGLWSPSLPHGWRFFYPKGLNSSSFSHWDPCFQG